MTQYNGWTNYETWNVKLWIDNGDLSYWEEIAEEIFNYSFETEYLSRHENAVRVLSERIKSEFEENTPTVTGCYADLLNSALSSVDWKEISESIFGNLDLED